MLAKSEVYGVIEDRRTCRDSGMFGTKPGGQ